MDEAPRLIERYEPPAPYHVDVPPRAATGHGATEAPRGVLFHRYAIDAEGLITSARIAPPTLQNQASIEDDLRRFAAARLDLDDQHLTWHASRRFATTTRASPARPISWISPWTAPNQASTAQAGPP